MQYIESVGITNELMVISEEFCDVVESEERLRITTLFDEIK